MKRLTKDQKKRCKDVAENLNDQLLDSLPEAIQDEFAAEELQGGNSDPIWNEIYRQIALGWKGYMPKKRKK